MCGNVATKNTESDLVYGPIFTAGFANEEVNSFSQKYK